MRSNRVVGRSDQEETPFQSFQRPDGSPSGDPTLSCGMTGLPVEHVLWWLEIFRILKETTGTDVAALSSRSILSPYSARPSRPDFRRRPGQSYFDISNFFN